MNERLLQYLWQFRYYNQSALFTITGERIDILFPGHFNVDQGPDFSEAKIRIGTTIWAGNVELHLKTSDWKRHGHDGDNRYSKIILHVVWHHDIGNWPEDMPLLELRHRVSQLMLDTYAKWMMSSEALPCSGSMAQVSSLVWHSWKDRLVAERWENKIDCISRVTSQNREHWEETLWRLFCRYMGSQVNTESFEQLAQHLPLNMLSKHQNQIHQLEAMLFGTAGMLLTDTEDQYHELLKKEFAFLQHKYRLRVINKPPVFLRLRPANFPTIRLAQLAMLLHRQPRLFARLLAANTVNEMRLMLQTEPNDYWLTHYRPGIESDPYPKPLGNQMIDTLIINAILPVIHSYDTQQSGRSGSRALQWLQQLPQENNKVTRIYATFGVDHQSAFDSQAFLQLKKHYCDPRRCLECAVAGAILKPHS